MLLLAAILAAASVSPSLAQSPAPGTLPAGATGDRAGVIGSGTELLVPVAGEVGVVAAAVVPAPGSGADRLLVVVGNGTDAPVDARVAWAAADAGGTLAWVGEFGGSLAVGDDVQAGEVPEGIPPGGLGLFLTTPDAVSPDGAIPADAGYTFAVVADEPDGFGDRVDLNVDAELRDGAIAGTLTNPAVEPVERRVLVLGFCLGDDGTPTGSQGLSERLDAPLAAGASMPFRLDVTGIACPAFLVGATGAS
jgi:hypothetical protein